MDLLAFLTLHGLPAAVRGGEAYVPLGNMNELIDCCEGSGVAVIGLEAITVEEGGATPLPDWIADCTPDEGRPWREWVSLANTCAREFVAKLPKDPRTHLAIVLKSGQ
jgi:hypothetical protein